MKKQNTQAIFSMGVSLVGLGVVFAAAVNPALGLSFLATGFSYMFIGREKK